MDKKIQEIRTALAEATPGPWAIGAPSPSGAINIGAKGLLVAQCAKKEQAHLIANAPTYISYLLQQIDQVDEIRESLDVLKQQMIEIRNYTAKLKKQIEIKDKALKWYATIENYEIGNFTVDQNGELDEWESRVQQDAGEKARTALKGEDTP
ncbi:hypothetical protein WGM54_03550 [Paenibacillus polymyxa]|uniref:hypothetical protein n=1 Tax=Paenibacillus polymyxa TaxID=1406 RepID=UPI00307E1367